MGQVAAAGMLWRMRGLESRTNIGIMRKNAIKICPKINVLAFAFLSENQLKCLQLSHNIYFIKYFSVVYRFGMGTGALIQTKACFCHNTHFELTKPFWPVTG